MPNSAISDTCDRDYITSVGTLELDVDDAEALLNTHDLSLGFKLSILANCVDLVSYSDRPLSNPAYEHLAVVLVRFRLSHEHLEIALRVELWRRNLFHDSVQ